MVFIFDYCGGYGGMSGGRLWHLLARGLLVRNNDKGENEPNSVKQKGKYS